MESRSRSAKEKGAPLGIGGPRRRVSIAGVVFTPARGVIHPSFPLRGRWERSAKSNKQAPSPSLVSLHSSSSETRPPHHLMHGFRQCWIRPGVRQASYYVELSFRESSSVCAKSGQLVQFGTGSGLNRERPPRIAFERTLPTWFQDPGNEIFELPGLSVFSPVLLRILPCLGSSANPFRGVVPPADSTSLESSSWAAHSRSSQTRPHCCEAFPQAAATAIVRNRACKAAA